MNLSRTLIAVSLVALAACEPKGGAGTTDGQAQAAPPVATVNGTPIDREFFEVYVKGVAGKPSSELTAEQREQLLDNLIRARLVAEQAVKDGVTKETETAALLELTRLNVLQQAMSERYLKDKKPTEEELRAEYDLQVAALPKLEYNASHVLLPSESAAQAVIARLEKGANFADIARRESTDKGSGGNGGDLGWFTPDRMVKPFSDAVAQLKPGEFTRKPVQTQFGWHVIRLNDTRELSPPAFDVVRQRLEQVVQSKKFKAYTDELMKNAKVEKNI